ncbi:TetR family transcriptional regulator [Arcanobacterium phocisimile]|uniref:TetR family transcriptional regulator n=1 Tax=Arcanobacterium phocisimile TaxID=1302235 RepID=A0ABX7IH31_9ACTO|nr:TetR/AcrR family transcriptional regulator [Arcanobacterium phocisimile]QRV02433.1 TetR family transcriptional regulator [Arcanobacterium phocisimile]
MRTSKKTTILKAIVEIIEESGVSGVTYEAVATKCELSKSGLIYHFPSRETMLEEAHRYMAQHWEESLRESLDATDNPTSVTAILKANLAVSQHAATRAELLMTIDAASTPELYTIWSETLDQWTCAPDKITTDPRACQAYLVQLIADGLWAHDYINGRKLTKEQRAALVDAALNLIPGNES